MWELTICESAGDLVAVVNWILPGFDMTGLARVRLRDNGASAQLVRGELWLWGIV